MKPHGHLPCHECCPKEFREIPMFTGNHELDAVIHRNDNKDMARRMKFYSDSDADLRAYTPQTAYNAYSGYGTVD